MKIGKKLGFLLALLALVGAVACSKATSGAGKGGSAEPSASPPSGKLETAILAGGCFWGMEEILRGVPGVVSTDVGYTGGKTSAPDYEQVHTGETGHAEAIRIVFDP